MLRISKTIYASVSLQLNFETWEIRMSTPMGEEGGF